MCFFGLAINLGNTDFPIKCWKCKETYPIPAYLRLDGKYNGRVYCENCRVNVKDKCAEFIKEIGDGF